jgi:transcriptional regulator with XRE-family HTH domain
MSSFSKNSMYTWGIMSGRPPLKEAPPFGKKLAALRKARGLSQQKLAEILETTRSAVDYYERRAENPTAELVQKCANVFSVSVAELIGNQAEADAVRKRGPKSALERSYEQVSNLPRAKQQQIIKVVDALLAQAS